MITQILRDYVSGRLQWLQRLPEHPQKAALARLRRGVGRVPGDLPELWGIFLQGMPTELQSKTGKPSQAEWAVYLTLTLYALHQQGHGLPKDNMNRGGERLGCAVRRLVKPGEEASDSSILRRFNALASATDMRGISHHLRGMIQLLRASGIPIDYVKLADDLYKLQFPNSAPQVRLKWGQDFYAPLPNNLTDNQPDKGEENENEFQLVH